MNEQAILHSLDVTYNFILRASEGVSEEMADQMPPGFRNNIRWNLGHVYVINEKVLFGLTNSQPHLPPNYDEMFKNGTSPADWTTTPPSLNELKFLLREQSARIQATFTGRMDEISATPFRLGTFTTMETIGEIICFSLFHNGIHVEKIRTIRRLLEAK